VTVEHIAEPGDPRVAAYHALVRGRTGGEFIAESRLVVEKLLRARRFRVASVLTTEAALAPLAAAIDAAADAPVVYVASRETLSEVVGFAFHRGCLALGALREPPRLDLLLAARRLVALEDVSNPDNVGGVFRAAHALGAEGVLLSPGAGDPLHRKAVRVSMGGVLELPFVRAIAWPLALDELAARGFMRIALVPDGDRDVAELGRAVPVPERFVLLLGAEGHGLAPATRARAELALRIHMAPGADSLNVVTALAIALHHISSPRP
jgi:tRNA G18 (ribose-2'-O)-methylase SpoU